MSEEVLISDQNKSDFKCQLEFFEGPLDLLLYLIKKNEIDINNLKMETITGQYLEYINLMQTMNVDIASEFIVTAATLLHIKTKWLLPVQNDTDENEEDIDDDPRLDLLAKLIEYKKFKEAGEHLGKLHDDESSTWKRLYDDALNNESDSTLKHEMLDLLQAFNKVLKSKKFKQVGEVHGEKYTVSQKINDIRHYLLLNPKCNFHELLNEAENKDEIVCLFLGILELIRLQEILVEQSKGLFSEIFITRNQIKLNTIEEQN